MGCGVLVYPRGFNDQAAQLKFWLGDNHVQGNNTYNLDYEMVS